MAKVTVYDLEGTAHEMEPVDARECCTEMGWSMTDPEEAALERANDAARERLAEQERVEKEKAAADAAAEAEAKRIAEEKAAADAAKGKK